MPMRNSRNGNTPAYKKIQNVIRKRIEGGHLTKATGPEGERLREPDERLFEKVEERRPGVRTQDADELGRGEPRNPDREDFVVPERARDEQPQASGNGKSGSDQCGGQSEALAVVTLSFDGLS